MKKELSKKDLENIVGGNLHHFSVFSKIIRESRYTNNQNDNNNVEDFIKGCEEELKNLHNDHDLQNLCMKYYRKGIISYNERNSLMKYFGLL